MPDDEKEIAEQHSRIKRKLQKRLLQPIENANQAKIAEIIAVSKYDGEFNYFNPNQEEVTARIYSQIIKLAKYAEEIHLKNNFEIVNKPVQSIKSKQNTSANKYAIVNNWIDKRDLIFKMKNDCKNIITRISTNEFFFYPNEKNGPLTDDEFGKLIRRIEKLAAGLSENLHLALGTFPVVNDLHQLNNILVYVQCGLNPRLDYFAKAFPAMLDPEYSKFKNIDFEGDTISLLRGHNLFKYKYIDYHGKIIIRQKPSTSDDTKDENKNFGYITNYGGQISCKTAGGLEFRTLADICLDSHKKLSRLALEANIDHDKATLGNIIPTHISQIIISSTIDKSDVDRMSRTKLFTHTDPVSRGISNNKLFKRISPYRTDELKNCFFGADIKIFIYAPIAVDQLQNEYSTLLNKHNELVLILDAYRILREQRPYQADKINHLVDKEVLNYFKNILNDSNDQLKNIKNKKSRLKLLQLKNDMQNYFNDALLEKPDFRKIVQNYHENLLTQFNEGSDKDIAPLLDILTIMNDLLLKDSSSSPTSYLPNKLKKY